jgi:hypothetical protein
LLPDKWTATHVLECLIALANISKDGSPRLHPLISKWTKHNLYNIQLYNHTVTLLISVIIFSAFGPLNGTAAKLRSFKWVALPMVLVKYSKSDILTSFQDKSSLFKTIRKLRNAYL